LTHAASTRLCADKVKSNATELAKEGYILGWKFEKEMQKKACRSPE
jgi:hypothetical protein